MSFDLPLKCDENIQEKLMLAHSLIKVHPSLQKEKSNTLNHNHHQQNKEVAHLVHL
jgi:hypothetical protein